MTQHNQPTATTTDWALLVLLSIIWGSSFLFGRILMLEWPPFAVAFLRVSIAAAGLWCFLLVSRRYILAIAKLAPQLLIMGILNNVIPFSLILIGQREIGSGLASVVNAMTPVWTLLIAHLATSDEKISGSKLLGIALGFGGVAVLVGSDFLSGLEASAWAQIAVLGATISYGCAAVYGKRFAGTDPVSISTGQLTASSMIMLPLVWLLEGGFGGMTAQSAELWASMLALALLCTALAYVLYFKILSSAGATTVSLVTFLVPVSAILLGGVFLGERLDISTIMGAIMILGGLILIDGRLSKGVKIARS